MRPPQRVPALNAMGPMVKVYLLKTKTGITRWAGEIAGNSAMPRMKRIFLRRARSGAAPALAELTQALHAEAQGAQAPPRFFVRSVRQDGFPGCTAFES